MSNADSVKLVLNGRAIAVQKVDKYEMNTFSVPFQAGKLEAFAYKNGREIARDKVETSGPAESIQLIADRLPLNGDGQDAVPVTVQVLDKKGRAVPTAQNLITFTIKGSGKIIGVGNGNPNSHELEKASKRSLFNGLAQVIVQADEGSETIELLAGSEGLKPFTLKIPVIKTEPVPFVKMINADVQLNDWRISAFSNARPNPREVIAENDMNSWMPTKTSELQRFTEGKYALYQSSFTMGSQANAQLHFNDIVGKAEIWLDDQLIYEKKNYEKANVDFPFTSQNKQYKLVVLMESETGKQAGLGGVVTVEIK